MRRARGFTLLEVLVALAIAGLVIGTLFSLLGGSKRLSWSASEALARSVYQRAAINAGQIESDPDYPEVPAERRAWRVEVEAKGDLPRHERQTRSIRYVLQNYEVLDADGNTLARSLRWRRLELAK